MIPGISEQKRREISSELLERCIGRTRLGDMRGIFLLGSPFYNEKRTYQARLEDMDIEQKAKSAAMPNYYRQGIDFMTNRPIFRRYKTSSEANPLTPIEVFSGFLIVPINRATHVLV